MAKAKKDRKIVVSGPSVVIDGKEVVGFKLEFGATFNQRNLSVPYLRDLALKHHTEFVRETSDALSAASGSQVTTEQPEEMTAEI